MEFSGIQCWTAKTPILLGIFAVTLITASSAGAQAEKSAGHSAEQLEIRQLLDYAAAAVRAGQLIYPARGSAMSLYHEALVLNPDNPEARRGLERLVDHFLSEATAAIEVERYSKANGALSRARMVDPDNPNIEPIAAELRLLENAERRRTVLDWRLVAARSSELTPTLTRAGARARNEGCRAVISVSSDAEGRWIYEQLSRAPGERRIQAQIRIASPSAVEVLCFRES